MTDLALRVDGLSKRYRIGSKSGGYGRLTETMWGAMRAPLSRSRTGHADEIWALNDVSIEVEQGEIVGIIGSNGAGKTTLLKVLSRITEPTRGTIRFRGRVGALLEVGTGFHPELSGRENIFLNGAILGMGRREIRDKFDEIVAFAEVEQFLDTPVKRYSSGMYVRLAFAVAAHLEPDILLVDEVLAVGDAAFQKKSLGKMHDVAREGRTVLLVSHNMGILQEIATRAVWLHKGRVVSNGKVREIIASYLSAAAEFSTAYVSLEDHPGRLPRMRRVLTAASLQDSAGEASRDFLQTDDICVELEYSAPEGVGLAGAGFILTTLEGVRAGGFNTYMAQNPPHRLPPAGRVRFLIRGGQLNPATYVLTASVGSHPGVLEDKVENALSFEVHPADVYGTGFLLSPEDGVATLRADVQVEGGDQ